MHARRCIALVLAVALGGSGSAQATPANQQHLIRSTVEFRVLNSNRSAVPCSSDGLPYRVRGTLTMPRSALQQPARTRRVLLALHEFSFGQFFWNFPDQRANFAATLARAGHSVLAIDRLGYDSSDHPVGTSVCLGAQADITAQVARALRNGTYQWARTTAPPAFGRLILVGHSVGAGIAELATHSFDDLRPEGLLLMAWADHSYSTQTLVQSIEQAHDCSQGGAQAEPNTTGGYAWFGRSEAAFQANLFFDADPAIVRAATRLRNRDPCGDNASLARLAVVNIAKVPVIRAPVFLAYGAEDPVFADGAEDRQAALFRSSSALTRLRLPRAAHALVLERSAPQLSAAVLSWLARVQ